MKEEEKRHPLLTEEDWWTVWFGMAILLLATILGILAVSGNTSPKKVPKLGTWVSNPSDVFYNAQKTRINLGETATLQDLANLINTGTSLAEANIEQAGQGVRLHVTSSRTGDGQTISLRTLLSGGEPLQFTVEGPDSGGLGAHAYVSQVLPSAETLIGTGNVAISAERADNGGFTARATWRAAGSVGHWGHVHRRINRYMADLTVEPVEGSWKLTGLEILEEDRI